MANASMSDVEERVTSSVTKKTSTVTKERQEGGKTVKTVTKTKELVEVQVREDNCGCTIQ